MKLDPPENPPAQFNMLDWTAHDWLVRFVEFALVWALPVAVLCTAIMQFVILIKMIRAYAAIRKEINAWRDLTLALREHVNLLASGRDRVADNILARLLVIEEKLGLPPDINATVSQLGTEPGYRRTPPVPTPAPDLVLGKENWF